MDPSSTSEIHAAFGTPTRTLAALATVLELALESTDLSLARYRILGFVAHGPTTPSEVAIWLSVKKQSVTSQLDALVALGYLTRAADPADRRRVIHTITRSGVEALLRAEAAVDSYLEVVLDTVTDRQAATVRRGLEITGIAMTRLLGQVHADPTTLPAAGLGDAARERGRRGRRGSPADPGRAG